MATSVTQVRQGLADRVATTGLDSWPRWQNVVTPPCAMVEQCLPETDQTFSPGVLTRYLADIIVVVRGSGGVENAGGVIEPYISPSGAASVTAAINADRTLGGVAQSTFFGQWEPFVDERIGTEAFGQRLPVTVWA